MAARREPAAQDNLDLFPELLPKKERAPRVAPGQLMHVEDAGEREDGQRICVMACRRCGARSGWLPFKSVSEAKRGIPCEACNAQAKANKQ